MILSCIVNSHEILLVNALQEQSISAVITSVANMIPQVCLLS